MSNLFSSVLAFIFVIPVLLFGVDIMMLQTVSSGLEAYATSLVIKASSNGLKTTEITQAEQAGYRLVCLVGCEYPQIGQTQTFVLEKTYTPLFISNEEITVAVRRSYIVGYY